MMNVMTPIVIHIPHASRTIPSDIRASIILSDSDLEIELTKMTDAYTDELFTVDTTGNHSVVFPISRLVLDPERFIDDDQEIMAACGMGVIYTRTSDGQRLRFAPTHEERSVLIERYYHPHHCKLDSLVSDGLSAFGHCLIIDGHSFPSVALPYELDQSTERPDICIGADGFHTPERLRDRVCDEFEKLGYSTTVNKPFAGTIVPMAYYQKESCVMSIMVEVNRRLYMDEQTGQKSHGFDSVKQHIFSVIEKIGSLEVDKSWH